MWLASAFTASLGGASAAGASPGGFGGSARTRKRLPRTTTPTTRAGRTDHRFNMEVLLFMGNHGGTGLFEGLGSPPAATRGLDSGISHGSIATHVASYPYSPRG